MDSLIFLSPTGRLVYSGPTASLDVHLAALDIDPPPSTLNVADFLLDYIISASPGRVRHMISSYKQSDVWTSQKQKVEDMVSERAGESMGGARLQLPPGAKRRPLGVQLWMLSAVLFRRMYRHPFLIATGFVATLVAAVSLAVAFWDTGYDTQVQYPDRCDREPAALPHVRF